MRVLVCERERERSVCMCLCMCSSSRVFVCLSEIEGASGREKERESMHSDV